MEIHGAHGYLLDSYLRAFGTGASVATDVTPETFVYRLVQYVHSPLPLAGWCRRITGLPTITVGHVRLDPRQFFGNETGGLSTLMDQIAGRQFDLVAMGRALLKNPDWVGMVKRRKYAELIAAGSAQ